MCTIYNLFAKEGSQGPYRTKGEYFDYSSMPLCKRACLTKIYRTLGRQYNSRLRAMQIPVGVKWAHLHGSINNTSVIFLLGRSQEILETRFNDFGGKIQEICFSNEPFT
jgi:hypothetical protein